jgi:hypothetical protein
MWICNLCAGGGKEFIVPADEIGKALMTEHLFDSHGVKESMLPGGLVEEKL